MLQEYSASFTWGASGHAESTHTVIDPRGVPGKTHTLVYVVSNCTNSITCTFKLYDPHGSTLYSKASIAKGATTIDVQEYVFGEGWILGVDPSGDAGVSGLTVTVYIYWDDGR